MKNSASFDTKIVSLPIFSGYDPYLNYIYCTIIAIAILIGGRGRSSGGKRRRRRRPATPPQANTSYNSSSSTKRKEGQC